MRSRKEITHSAMEGWSLYNPIGPVCQLRIGAWLCHFFGMWPPLSGPQFSSSGKWRWLASPTLSLETVVHISSWEEKAAFWQSNLPFLDFSLAKDTKARHWPIIPSQLKPCSPLLQLGNKGLLTSPQGATFWRSHVWSPHWTCGASAQLSGPGPRTACRYTDPNLLSPAKGEKGSRGSWTWARC